VCREGVCDADEAFSYRRVNTEAVRCKNTNRCGTAGPPRATSYSAGSLAHALQLSLAHLNYPLLCSQRSEASTELQVTIRLFPVFMDKVWCRINGDLTHTHVNHNDNVVRTRKRSAELVLVIITDISLPLSGSERLCFLLSADEQITQL